METQVGPAASANVSVYCNRFIMLAFGEMYIIKICNFIWMEKVLEDMVEDYPLNW